MQRIKIMAFCLVLSISVTHFMQFDMAAVEEEKTFEFVKPGNV